MSIPKPVSCVGCVLASSSSGFSSLEGSGSSGLLVVSEALGKHEEADGLPLRPYAPAGSVFQRTLDELHLQRSTMTLTNCIRCQPPGNELRDAPYEFAALNHCKQYLNATIAERQPKAILALGAVPLRELLDPDSGVPADLMSVRGFLLRSKYSGIPLIACVDPETECLTGSGWKRYDQLRVGEAIAALNIAGKLEWQPLEAVHVYENISTPMLQITGQCLDMMVSPDHKCVVRQTTKDKKVRLGRTDSCLRTVYAKELKDYQDIPLSAEWEDANQSTSLTLPLELVELLGWYISEGSPHGSGVRIYQSRKVNSAYCERIKFLLDNLNADYSEREPKQDQIVFGIYGRIGKWLRKLSPTKQFPIGFLLWSRPTLLALFEGLYSGDGSKLRYNSDQRVWHQKDLQWISDFQALCTRLGWTTSARTQSRARGNEISRVAVYPNSKSKWRSLDRTVQEWISYRGTIWCPQTPLGTWVARRNGKVFITGNSYHPAHLVRGSMHLLSAVLPDAKFAYRVATEGAPKLLETKYELFPTIDDVRRFYLQLASDQSRPVAVDVETIELLGKRDEADWRRKTLIQIQFSDGPGRAIVLPWTGRFIDAAKAILALDNPKWTWNGRLSDLLVLRGSGCTVNGEHHDLMNALIHLQPSFTAGRDDKFGDKGIVTKLLGLQSCASFYCPEVGPWKHLAYERDKLQLYGAYDADYTMRCGIGLFADLKAQGLLEGYSTFKRGLCEVLDDLGEMGLPIDRERQQELRTYTLGELDRLQKTLQPLIPEQLRNRHPKEGWRSNPSSLATVDGEVMKLRDAIAKYDSYEAPPYVTIGDPAKARVSAPTEGHLVYREFELIDENAIPYTETRWCLLKPFNPGSQGESGQVGRYITYRGYPMPHKIDDPSKGTVGKGELEKLAAKVNDPVLNLVVEYKDIRKTGMDYTTGAWSPGADGRVHSTFRPNTASGQTTSSAPNVQQFPEHGGLAKRAKAMIRAEPGHVLVKVDYKGFHSRAIGHLAEDPIYYRLADFDTHSFITAHFLRLHDAPYLIDMEDDELRVALLAIKKEHGFTRNYKVKRTTHGRQFNMGLNKLYKMHADNFDPKIETVIAEVGEAAWHGWGMERQVREIAQRGRAEATKLFYLFDRLFPKTFIDFPAKIEHQIHYVTRCELRSPFQCRRYFWDYDKEQSTAYLPSNTAHCHAQERLIQLRKEGYLREFGFTNWTHDAGWFHVQDNSASIERCLMTVRSFFESESTVMVNSLGPFFCKTDAEVGPSLAEMESI